MRLTQKSFGTVLTSAPRRAPSEGLRGWAAGSVLCRAGWAELEGVHWELSGSGALCLLRLPSQPASWLAGWLAVGC